MWQGNHQIHGHIRCVYTVLANPKHIAWGCAAGPKPALPGVPNEHLTIMMHCVEVWLEPYIHNVYTPYVTVYRMRTHRTYTLYVTVYRIHTVYTPYVYILYIHTVCDCVPYVYFVYKPYVYTPYIHTICDCVPYTHCMCTHRMCTHRTYTPYVTVYRMYGSFLAKCTVCTPYVRTNVRF